MAARTQNSRKGLLIPVEQVEDIPAFADESEEHAFWSTHELAGDLLERMHEGPSDLLPPPSAFRDREPRTRPIAVRLDTDVLRRLKALAERKHKGYQTLLKEFVVERLYEEEKREGILLTSSTPSR
jgi:hypothetical protein